MTCNVTTYTCIANGLKLILFMFMVNVLKYNVLPFYPNFKGLSEDGSDSCYCVLVTMYILLTIDV